MDNGQWTMNNPRPSALSAGDNWKQLETICNLKYEI